MSVGSFIAAVLGAFVAASIQIGILHRGDLVLSVALALLFIAESRTALLFAIVGGFFLDLSSAIFGIRLVTYPLIVIFAQRLCSTLLDRSVVSAVIVGVCGYMAFTLLFILVSSGFALVGHNGFPFAFGPLMADIALGLGAQIAYVLAFMGSATLLKKP